MPKFSKGIIPYQLTKLQAPTSYSFQDTVMFFADKFKMPKFSKGTNSRKIRWFFFFFLFFFLI